MPVGQVGDADGRVGGVHRLAARPRRAVDVDLEVVRVDRATSTSSASGSTVTVADDVWIRPCALGDRHPLHAVGPALVLQAGPHAVALDRGT